jgi:chemotaxis protein CheX
MSNVDINILKPFIDGTIKTLEVQCGVSATTGKPYLKGSNNERLAIDIAGIIGITSPAFRGSIALCFPADTFLALMGKMLGETYIRITKELESGAGELINIIFGSAKTVLNGQGHAVEKALPSVITGKGLQVNQVTRGPVLVLPLETNLGGFHIEVSISTGATD